MKQRKRTIERQARRDLARRLSKARRDAADRRAAHGMCPHGDEEKIYGLQADIDTDKSSNVICGECGKPKLRVAILREGPTRPLPEFGELVIKDLLRREE